MDWIIIFETGVRGKLVYENPERRRLAVLINGKFAFRNCSQAKVTIDIGLDDRVVVRWMD